MLRIGLTGGIGTGKSRVARLLAELGAAVIDADAIARQVVEPGGAAYRSVVARFGSRILRPDGSLDRAALADIVFSDPDARRDLEALVHPAVRTESARRLAELERSPQPPAVAVFDIPLLFEAGRAGDFDQVWVVYAPDDVAVTRATARSGLSPEQIRARMRAQWPIAEKVRRADVVIDNSGDWAETAAQVRRAWQRLLARDGAS
ncbi:MAG TPA: dephospho-CoA kinase [Bacillota bacterium]